MMMCREKDPFFIEMERKQKFKDDNILETAMAMGLTELAMEILEEDYRVKVSEHKGQVLIDSDVSKYSYGENSYSDFNELGFFMIEKDIRFLNEASSFQMDLKDFIELADELVKDIES